MDKETCDVLANWGFADKIPQFYCEKIDHDGLLRLDCTRNPIIAQIFTSEESRKNVITKLSIYQGLIFNNSEIQVETEDAEMAEQNYAEECENNQPESDRPILKRPLSIKEEIVSTKEPRIESSSENEFYVQTADLLAKFHLLKTNTGEGILINWRNKVLSTKVRNEIVDIIIRTLMEIKIPSSGDKIELPRLENYHWDLLTRKFCDIFIKEDPRIYYIPPKTNGKDQPISREKFVDKYRNLRTFQAKLGLINTKKSDSGHNNENEENFAPNNEAPPSEHILWLLNNDSPWGSVLNHWQLSIEERLPEFRHILGNVQDIFNKYPVLKQPSGHELIEIDFTYEKGREGTIYVQWPDLSIKLYELMQNEIRDPTSRILLETLATTDIPDDEVNLKLLLLLSALCPPVVKIIKKGSKSIWKPSIQESQESFILHVKTPGDIDKSVRTLRDKYAKFDIQLQPSIIAVGPALSEVTAFYVNIDDTRYRFQNILAALDLCFKSFHVLHAQYPKPSEQVWLFLQKTVYALNTKWDEKATRVATLLAAIKNM